MKLAKSPWRSHISSPLDFPKPPEPLDPRLIDFPKSRLFESSAFARSEDLKRAKRLKSEDNRKDSLGTWLQEATVNRSLPLSLASSFYWRTLRLRLPAALVNACELDPRINAIIPFTIIFPKHRIAGGELLNYSANFLKSQLRNILVSAGVESADGILFACLHGSFDGAFYELHFHGFVAGDKAIAFEKLRAHPELQSCEEVYRPFQTEKPIALSDPVNLISWLTYCLKPYWPWKPYWFTPAGVKKKGGGRRLKAKQEVEFLTWMAGQNLGDLILLMGRRLTDLKKRGV